MAQQFKVTWHDFEGPLAWSCSCGETCPQDAPSGAVYESHAIGHENNGDLVDFRRFRPNGMPDLEASRDAREAAEA